MWDLQVLCWPHSGPGRSYADLHSIHVLSFWLEQFLYFWHTYLDRNLQNSSPNTNPLLTADSSAVASVFNTCHVSTFQVLLQDEQCSASCAAEDDPGRHQEQGCVWRDRSRPHKQTPGRKTIGALMTSSTETPPPPLEELKEKRGHRLFYFCLLV